MPAPTITFSAPVVLASNWPVERDSIDLGVSHNAAPGTLIGVCITLPSGDHMTFNAVAKGISEVYPMGPIVADGDEGQRIIGEAAADMLRSGK